MATALRSGSTIELPAETSHYVARVLRLHEGAGLIVFNGDGEAYDATLTAAAAKSAQACIGERIETHVESPLHVTLVQGLCRGQRMDYCVQKATELGVARIVPVQMDRSVVRLSADKGERKVEHWRAIAISACEQSGRVRIPAIDPPASLRDVLTAAGHGAIAMLDARGSSFDDWRCVDHALTIVIGPEGGYSNAERERLVAAGAQRWRMGPRVLRTETAGMVALALAQSKWGDLR